MEFFKNAMAGAFVGIILGFAVGALIISNISYRAGQIEALSGNIKYELRSFDDGTVKWRKIQED